MEHFGVKLIDRGKGFHLTRDGFATINTRPSLPHFASLSEQNAYTDKDGTAYSERWCAEYREVCLRNFDLNMEYYSRLEKTTFDAALSEFLSKFNGFVEVTNLNDFANVEGFYILILDAYKQVYIGKSKDVRARITKHWSTTKPFDRTLFPMYAWRTSVFSIDFFRALDTTRIFAWKKKVSDGIEARLVSSFPAQFCTNRIGGDVTDALKAINTMNQRPY